MTKAEKAVYAAQTKTVTDVTAAIADGTINASNVANYLAYESKHRKTRVSVMEALGAVVVNAEPLPPEPEDSGAPIVTMETLRLEAAEKKISDQRREAQALQSKIAKLETAHRNLQLKHDAATIEYTKMAKIKTVHDGKWTQIVHLTNCGEFCFGDRSVFEKWAKLPPGRGGYIVDVEGPHAWTIAHRHAPGCLTTLADGTVRVTVTAAQQADTVMLKLRAYNRQPDIVPLKLTLRDAGDLLTKAYDAGHADGFGVRDGLAVLRASEVVLALTRDAAGQVTGVRLDVVAR